MAHYVIGDHARFEMKRRGIAEEEVEAVIASPEQVLGIRPGRVVMQSRVTVKSSSTPYLMRVFVDIDRDTPEVVTVYRTSKVLKYWRQQP
jgi:hypothetical protein